MSVAGMHEGGGNFVLIGHEFYQLPDMFTVLEGQAGANSSEALFDDYPTYADNESGDWWFSNDTGKNETRAEMVYILSDKGQTGWARKRPMC